MKSISLLAWAYNEEKNVSMFLERALSLLEECTSDYEIIIVDDGSTDKTIPIIESYAAKNPRIRLVPNIQNRGASYSHRRAIQLATKEIVSWQTLDWSYEISRLADFLKYSDQHDVVLGVREVCVRRRSDNPKKALVSLINYLLVRFLFRIPLSDFQNIALYPRLWLQNTPYEANSAFGSPEFLIKAHLAGLSILEVPVPFIPRVMGEAKGVTPKTIGRTIQDMAKLWFRWMILKKIKRAALPGTITRLKGHGLRGAILKKLEPVSFRQKDI